jgi:hypothetical protein
MGKCAERRKKLPINETEKIREGKNQNDGVDSRTAGQQDSTRSNTATRKGCTELPAAVRSNGVPCCLSENKSKSKSKQHARPIREQVLNSTNE